jgi:uncharacterized protein (DUF433 family)
MNTIQSFEQLLSGLKKAEKAQLLQWVARDLGDAFPGIDSTPGVCGGEPCIVRTRIPVWVLAQARNLGMSEAEILQIYPSLRAEDLVNAWNYYRSHQNEIDQQIDENEAA